MITPEVSIKQTTVEHLDKILGEDDKIIFQCIRCETYLLPRELHTLTRQGRGGDGNVYSEVIFQCPVCDPFPDKDKPVPADFIKYTREAYERRRMYERANLIMPEDVKLIH
jgi:hypothetical protein